MRVFSLSLFLATLLAASLGLSYLSWQLVIGRTKIMRSKTAPNHKNYLYLKHYMLGHHSQYMKDSKAVAEKALRFAKSQKVAADGNDIWIFDIDDTLISHLPYFAKHGLGTEPMNVTLFVKWMNKSKAPALPASLNLYRELLSLGFKIVLLTGRPEEWKMSTVNNLKKVGYHSWEKIILKASSYPGNLSFQSYKSNERRKLVEINGYRIIGNVGDQWSDIRGSHRGSRTFKLPNPMYNIS